MNIKEDALHPSATFHEDKEKSVGPPPPPPPPLFTINHSQLTRLGLKRFSSRGAWRLWNGLANASDTRSLLTVTRGLWRLADIQF